MSFTNDKDSDNYATDKKGWEIIQSYIPKDKVIWSPFYCDGKQKEYFEEMGYNIIHEDKDFFSFCVVSSLQLYYNLDHWMVVQKLIETYNNSFNFVI